MAPDEVLLDCARNTHARVVEAICLSDAGDYCAALASLRQLELQRGERLDLMAQMLIARLRSRWAAALGDYQQAYQHCCRHQELFELCANSELPPVVVTGGEDMADAAVGVVGFLTAREQQVFSLVAQGLSTKEIARRFGISPRTVEIHRARVQRKLGVNSLAELARLYDQLAGSAAVRPA
ncbi:MAG: helix-turn-helix transcriptional regulator [Chitinivorax sp.]